MSSTNRGYDRHKSDYYVTPIKSIKEFLGAWLYDMQYTDDNYIADRPDKISRLDPCAGGDKNHPMSYPSVLVKEFGNIPDTIDIREDSLADVKGDFLKMQGNADYDVVITNPPFNIAMEIIQKSFDFVKDGGYVIMLLRLNFFGSKVRYKFFQDNMPESCYIHHRRMSFTDSGTTDSIEYAHFVWKKGYKPLFTKTYVI